MVHVNRVVLDKIKELTKLIEDESFKRQLKNMTNYYSSVPTTSEYSIKDAHTHELMYVDMAVRRVISKILYNDKLNKLVNDDVFDYEFWSSNKYWDNLWEGLFYSEKEIKNEFKISNKLASAYISMMRFKGISCLKLALRDTLKIEITNEITKSRKAVILIKKHKKNETKLFNHLKQIKNEKHGKSHNKNTVKTCI